MYCQKCGKQLDDSAAYCSGCGDKINKTSQITTHATIPAKKTNKKRNGCLSFLIAFVIIFVIIGIISAVIQTYMESENLQSDKTDSISDEVSIVLDATKFIVNENTTVSEEQLIEILGNPENTEEWNYKTSTHSYPIKTLYYENETYAYHFNSGVLQRISINDVKIPYTAKNKILGMFGLKKHTTSKVVDTGVAYRVTNCGIHDLWIAIMDEDTLNSIRISYGSLFSE